MTKTIYYETDKKNLTKLTTNLDVEINGFRYNSATRELLSNGLKEVIEMCTDYTKSEQELVDKFEEWKKVHDEKVEELVASYD